VAENNRIHAGGCRGLPKPGRIQLPPGLTTKRSRRSRKLRIAPRFALATHWAGVGQ
jgi:hypothetical protein